MRNTFYGAAVVSMLLIAAAPVRAQDTRPTEISVRQLLDLMGLKKMHEDFLKGLDASAEASLRQTIARENMGKIQEKVYADWVANIVAMLKHDMSVEKFASMYIESYRKVLTQQEVDGMIAFYSSETGKAVVTKMPVIMQDVAESMKRRMEVRWQEEMQKEGKSLLRKPPSTE
jgi:hypothetical protein